MILCHNCGKELKEEDTYPGYESIFQCPKCGELTCKVR